MKLANTKDRKLTTVSTILHGDSGSGKTTSALTLPSDVSMIANGERGKLPLPLRNASFPILSFRSWSDIQDIYRIFLNPDAIEDAEIKKAVKTTKILFIDSLNACSDYCVHHIVTVERKRLIHERTKGQRDTPTGVYDSQMAIEDWQLYGTRMANLITVFGQLPIHVIFTCPSKWSKDKHGGDTLRTPNLFGKLSTECSRYVDIMLHMASDATGNRQWQTFPDGEIAAKDASGSLAPFEETDWTKLFTKILKGNDGGSK